jgi:hypothetical protein
MPRSPARQLRRLAFVGALAAGVLTAGPAAAQPPQMCGDGTSFTVSLPGLSGVPGDSVTLPRGCRIYAIFVSGYSVNPALDLLAFYKLARVVAANDGYVHYAWWNNFFGEYLSRPLHQPVTATPGNLFSTHALGFVPRDPVESGQPKAIPEEDHQFRADARLVIRRIRELHPDAIVIVAGHSMGGNAVARLGADPGVSIDLLAPIDPVGNRTRPIGTLALGNYNWTRQRVAEELIRYERRNCVRNAFGLCQDFDPRPFHTSYRCVTETLDRPPVPFVGSLAPIICPQLLPNIVTKRTVIGPNVRFLYHRWQNEFPFPFDILAHERLDRTGPSRLLTGLLQGNYQQPVLRNAPGESDRTKTCGVSGTFNLALLIAQVVLPGFAPPDPGVQPNDPNDPFIPCNPFDGHGELVGGGRGLPFGVRAQDWPCYTRLVDPGAHCLQSQPEFSDLTEAEAAALRRALLVDLAAAPAPAPLKNIFDLPSWPHEPLNPNLDLVVTDMITIVEHLLGVPPEPVDVTAPSTAADVSPEPNAAGWHRDDVQVGLSTIDSAGGSGVKEIEYTTAGAHISGPVVAAGGAAEVLVATEGVTVITFFARDHAGNVEEAQEVVVSLDRTAPALAAVTSAEPNAAGWFGAPVTVSFPASDALSGLAHVTSDVRVSTEGAGQEVNGTAEDVAGNLGSAAAILNIDLTPPAVTITTAADGAAYLLNAVVPAAYACADSLSGVASCTGTVPNGEPIDTSSVGSKAFTVEAVDKAGHAASRTHAYDVRYAFSGFGPPLGAAAQINAGQTVPVKYALSDASGTAITSLTSFVSLTSSPAACDGSTSTGPWQPVSGRGRTALRYSPRDGHFIFDWQTDRSWRGTCRTLRLELNDGTTHSMLVRFR